MPHAECASSEVRRKHQMAAAAKRMKSRASCEDLQEEEGHCFAQVCILILSSLVVVVALSCSSAGSASRFCCPTGCAEKLSTRGTGRGVQGRGPPLFRKDCQPPIIYKFSAACCAEPSTAAAQAARGAVTVSCRFFELNLAVASCARSRNK